nr:SCO family protein [Jannaschia sp. S6380]
MEARTPSVVATDLGAPFELVDHDGNEITEAAFEGRPSLLFFGFTHCPEVCPTTVYDMETWLLDLDVGEGEIGAYFVSVDPERDTPQFLKDYLEPQSDRIIGITGEPEKVWDMARSWRVYWQKRPLGEGDYTLDHYASIFVLDPEGRVVDLIGYGEDPESAKAKIADVLG